MKQVEIKKNGNVKVHGGAKQEARTKNGSSCNLTIRLSECMVGRIARLKKLLGTKNQTEILRRGLEALEREVS